MDTSLDRIAKAAKIFSLGIVCPDEMWRMVLIAIGSEDPIQALDSCSAQVQATLLAAYIDRPWSFKLIPADEFEAWDAVLEWCERNTNSPVTASRRRWPRFSLRTLFVVMTLLACWLAWDVHIVRGRFRCRVWIESHDGAVKAFRAGNEPDFVTIAWLRRLLGDGFAERIRLPAQITKSEAARIAELYPEAVVILGDIVIWVPDYRRL